MPQEPLSDETREPQRPDRRKFLTGAAAAAAASLSAETARADDAANSDLFLPEEAWRDRMKAPDDGKRYGWIVDTRRCFGCHGCEVACKSENDVPLGKFIRQTIYHDHEVDGPGGANGGAGVARIMAPMSCQHCEDAPCMKACPCGAIFKGSGGSVQIDYNKCSGHSACKEACPYGAIYIDPVANQAVKCHNCTHRVDVGMDPACVSTCPSEALIFGDLNDPESKISKMTEQMEREGSLETLRPEKNTNPRMKFAVDDRHPISAWEPKVPREGQSFAPEAYDVYSWGEPGWTESADGSEGEAR